MFLRGMVLLAAICLPLAAGAQAQPERDECDLKALGVCARHVVQDQVAIFTSPVHVRTRDLLWLVPFGVATGFAVDYDVQALRTLGHHPSQEDAFDQFSNAAAVYLPIAGIVGGYAAGSWKNNDYMKQTAVLSAEAILNAQLLNLPLKYALDRESPRQGDETGRFWPHGPGTWPDGQSMPSGHSLTAWSIAHVVAARYPGWGTRLTVYSLATAVSASRIMARQHFPSDVVVGSTLGYLVGGYIVHKHGDASRKYSFSMVNTPNGRGVQLSYNFGH